MQVNIKNLIDDTQCYDTVRELCWPEGREYPFCESRRIIRRGFDEKEDNGAGKLLCFDVKDKEKSEDAVNKIIKEKGRKEWRTKSDRCGVIFGNDSTIKAGVESIDIAREYKETHYAKSKII